MIDEKMLIERLEEEQEKLETDMWAKESNNWYGQHCNGVSEGYDNAIEIVKDLAEEHNNDDICLKCKYELERIDREPCVNCMHLYFDRFEPKDKVIQDSDKLSDTWKQQTMIRFERVE